MTQLRPCQPFHHRFACGAGVGAVGIVHHARRRIAGNVGQQVADQLRLPDAGQMRRHHVHPPVLRLAVVGGAVDLDRRRKGSIVIHWRGHKGAAPDFGVQQSLVGQDRISPRHGARRNLELPGKIAHRRQACALGQRPLGHCRADDLCHRLILGARFRRERVRPNCIHYNASIDSLHSPLYQYSWQ